MSNDDSVWNTSFRDVLNLKMIVEKIRILNHNWNSNNTNFNFNH